MKNTILTTLIAAVTIFAAAPAADAQRHHRHHHHHQPHHSSYVFISGYHQCGAPIYTERYVVRIDRRSRPVYGYRTFRHRPHHVRPAPRGYRVSPPPHRHHRHHRHSSSGGYINIRF